MSCNRSNNNENVMGNSGRRRCNCERENVSNVIAIRGPGCISGTGTCGDFTASFVEGAQGFCGQVSPTGNVQHCWNNNNVGGTGGRRNCDDEVAGTGGRRCWQNVAGTGGRSRCDNDEVGGVSGRNRCDCRCVERCLEELLEELLESLEEENDNHCPR